MKRKLGIPGNRPLADFLPAITIKAKDLATEITNLTSRKMTYQAKIKSPMSISKIIVTLETY
jgi:hypothetical protein